VDEHTPTFAEFLRARNRALRAGGFDRFEPARLRGADSEPDLPRRLPLLVRLSDLNPLAPKPRTEIVHRIYRLEREIATGSIIDVVI